jgi:hypothetical protein
MRTAISLKRAGPGAQPEPLACAQRPRAGPRRRPKAPTP